MRGRAAAITVSVLAHAGAVAAFVVGLPMRDPPGAVDKGPQGIEVMLAAGAPAPAEPPKPQAVEPPPPPEPESEIVTSKDTAPDLIEAPKPQPRPEPRPKPMVQKPKPQLVPQLAKPAEATPQETQIAAAAVPSPQGQVGQQNTPAAGNGAARSSGGNPGAEANYYAVLSAWLERHKEYPARAQRRHSEGIAYLQFVVARDGKVLRYQINRSSGNRTLDEAVERMIVKADPVPPIPPELGKDRIEIVVPVEFNLK